MFSQTEMPLYALKSDLKFPTLKECAIFTNDAYNIDDLENKLPENKLPDGWKCFKYYPSTSGYFAKAYIKNWDTPNSMLVIAHRGTELNIQDLLDDVNIIAKKAPDQCRNAYNFCIQVYLELGILQKDGKQFSGKGTVTHVGHSLGSVIAQTMTGAISAKGLPLLFNLQKCITFENPGSMNIVRDFWSKLIMPEYLPNILKFLSERAEVYQAGVNLINSCNEQIGKCYRITSTIYNYVLEMNGGLPLPPPAEYLLNSTYIINNTRDQHKIAKIVNLVIGKKFETTLLNKAPFGFQKGYVEYLDSQQNHGYWKDYFTTIWEADTQLAFNLRQSYNNDQLKYEKEAFEALNLRYKEAQGKIKQNNSITNISMFKHKAERTSEQIMEEFYYVESCIETENKTTCIMM